MRHEYGDPRRGLSFEEMNFRSSLEGMGHELVAFDFMERGARVGIDAMRAELRSLAAETRPDLAFFFLFTDQLDPGTVEAVGRLGKCPTVNWFADDHWRFESFTRHFAPAIDLAVTTDADSLPKYRSLANTRVHLSQWACNRYAYDKTADGLEYDVTFIGQPHGNRREVIDDVRSAGFEVSCWGNGWEAGRIEHDQMVQVFGASRINLSPSNSSMLNPSLRMRLGAIVRGRRVDTRPRPSQIKGRTFEVPGSGGFLLTDRVPHLERYFEIGREIATFTSTEDLIDQIGWWLDHPDERAAVAEAGYRRVREEHTYDHRFTEIFRTMGLA